MQIAHKDLGTFIILSHNLSIHIWYPSALDLCTPASNVNAQACAPKYIHLPFFTTLCCIYIYHFSGFNACNLSLKKTRDQSHDFNTLFFLRFSCHTYSLWLKVFGFQSRPLWPDGHSLVDCLQVEIVWNAPGHLKDQSPHLRSLQN